jgi:hypothetical protein
MKIEIKAATGIEVGRGGAAVSRMEVRNRGLLAVGRRLLVASIEGRSLNETEQRALDMARAATPAAEPIAPAPAQAQEAPSEPAPVEIATGPSVEELAQADADRIALGL